VKRILGIILVVSVVVISASCAGGASPAATTAAPSPTKPPSSVATTAAPSPVQSQVPEWKTTWDQKVAAAKKEGEVTFYSTAGPGVRDEVTKGFANAFGITVNFVPAPPGELVQKLVTERTAGLNLADAINCGGGTSLTGLKPQGLLKPVEPELILPEVKDPKAWVMGRLPLVDKDGMVFGMLASYERNILINTELVKPGEISSLKDLLNPKWKGKMIMQDPVSGAGLGLVSFMAGLWGADQALEYVRGLAAQGTVFTRDWRMQVESVARGKYAIAIAPHPEATAEFKAAGAPLQSVSVQEGATQQTVGGALAVPAKTGHVNGSTVFVNWMLSKDGQAAFVRGMKLPGARVDSPREGVDPSYYPGPNEKVIWGDEDFFLRQGKMAPLVRQIVDAQGK